MNNNSEISIRVFIRDGIVESVAMKNGSPQNISIEIFDVDTDRYNREEYEGEMGNPEYSEFDNWIVNHCEKDDEDE